MENAWKAAARHWWERMRQAERELEQEREMRAVLREHLDEETERASARQRELRDALSRLQSKSDDCEGELRARLTWTESRLESKQDEANELLQKLEELRGQPSGISGELAGDDRNKIKIYEHEINEWDALCGNALRDYANETGCIVAGDHLGAAVAAALREVYRLRKDVAKWRELWEMERDAGNAEHKRLEAKLAAAGELAALAERIAKADAKHPMDGEDVEPTKYAGLILDYARKRPAAAPTWDNALRCELAEALDAAFRGDEDAFADELLDVATVAMRWRRAVLERGKR